MLCRDNRCYTSFQVKIKIPPPSQARVWQWCSCCSVQNIQWITRNNKTDTQHFKLDVPIWCKEGRLISHNALSWWDNEKWPQPATCQYQGWWCTDGPRFLFNPVFFKMIALVTFSLPVCQLDIAIFPLSSLSCLVSFILKRHFTHGWL